MTEWFEDESLWAALYPYMFSERRFEIADEQVQKALALTGSQAGVVLDLCCGPGRHAIALSKRGFRVIGVDRSLFLLGKAREKARAARVETEFICEDMRRFLRPRAFDLILNMFTSFGYFEDKKDDLKVLVNIHENLKPGGACLIDVIGKEWLAKVFQPTASSTEADGTIVIQRHEVLDDWTRLKNEWIMIKDGQARTLQFHHTVYSGQELKDRMLAAGFSDVKLYGDLDGNSYGRNASRLIAVGRKSR